MNNQEILISFCIPTFQRKRRVTECVKEIQKIKNDNIEILVCDNASKDGTKEAILKLLEKDKRITYIENKENIGAVANITKVLKKGKGKYLYLISDEDFVNIEFIEKQLVNDIINSEFDIGLGSIYNIITRKFFQKFEKETKKIIDKKDIKILLNNNYMSGIVLKKEKIDFNILNYYKECGGNLYPHILATLIMISVNKNIILKKYSEKICFMRDQEKTVITQMKDNKIIKYWSPLGRIEQLKFMIKFIKKEINQKNYQEELYSAYGKIYAMSYLSPLFSGNYLGEDYRNEKHNFYDEILKISEIKKYFKRYLIYFKARKLVKSIIPDKILQVLKGEK